MQNRHSHVPISQCDCMLQITVFTFHCYQLVLFFKKKVQRREGTDVVSMKLFFWLLKGEKSPRRVMKWNLEIFSKDLWKKSTITCFWQLNLRWHKDLGTENHVHLITVAGIMQWVHLFWQEIVGVFFHSFYLSLLHHYTAES